MLSDSLLNQLKYHDVFLAVINHDMVYSIEMNDTSESYEYKLSISECIRPPFSINAYFKDLKEIKPIIVNMEQDFRFYDCKTAKKTNINFTFNINEELEKRNLSDIAELVAQLNKEIREQFPNMHVYVDNRWPVEEYINVTVQFEPILSMNI